MQCLGQACGTLPVALSPTRCALPSCGSRPCSSFRPARNASGTTVAHLFSCSALHASLHAETPVPVPLLSLSSRCSGGCCSCSRCSKCLNAAVSAYPAARQAVSNRRRHTACAATLPTRGSADSLPPAASTPTSLVPPPPSSQQQSEPPSDSQPPPGGSFLDRIIKMKLPPWLITVLKQAAQLASGLNPSLMRSISIVLGFCLFVFGREMLLATHRVAPAEVMYSDFVTLLNNNRVRAARLESGTSRLYFDLRMQPAAVTAAVTAAAATTASSAAATPSAAAMPTGVAAHLASSAVAKHLLSSAAAARGVGVASSSAPDAAIAASAAPATIVAAEGEAAPAAAAATMTAATATQTMQRGRMERQYYIKLADKADPLLVTRILDAGVEYAVLKASFTSALANVFITALAVWLPLMPLIFILRGMLESRQGTSRQKKSSGNAATPSVTFADVAGVDSAKQELLEVVSVMKAGRVSQGKLKVKMPSGVLLCGPPGTGKTLLAKAVAGEAGVPFLAVSASEFVELFVGRGAARIRELFAEARKVAPCVVFVDELDAVGARRGMGFNDERDQTLNQLLTELDGFEGRSGVLFLAATNRMDVLDPALLRPGRINRKVVVPLPDLTGRRDILAVHLRGVPISGGEAARAVACEQVARVGEGLSGAELANVVNEASLLAARKNLEEVSLVELMEGLQRTKFGVNGQTGGPTVGLTQKLQKWAFDQAARAAISGDPRRVRVSSS